MTICGHIFSWIAAGALLSFSPLRSQDIAFQPGEKLTYSVGYKVIGLYLSAGSATFSASRSDHPSGTVYHLVGEGATNTRYDWIFKVRDRYESYFDIASMRPLRAIRHVSEGKYKKHEEVAFDQQNNIAVTPKGPVKTPDRIQDVISSVYYMRSIDFSKYKEGDKILFSLFFGHEVYSMYVRYVGKENIETNYGRFHTIKIQPMLLKGDTFKDEDDMEVWITDDNNHIPLRIESKLNVGSIKVDLSDYQNLRYPLQPLAKK